MNHEYEDGYEDGWLKKRMAERQNDYVTGYEDGSADGYATGLPLPPGHKLGEDRIYLGRDLKKGDAVALDLKTKVYYYDPNDEFDHERYARFVWDGRVWDRTRFGTQAEYEKHVRKIEKFGYNLRKDVDEETAD